MNDLISRHAAIDAALTYLVEYCGAAFDEDMQRMLKKRLDSLPSAQPEPLTDKEQRIFLAAMRRERKVCTYAHEPCEVPLTKVCDEIVRKVKGALWT